MSVTIDKIEVFGVAMPLAGSFTSGGVTKSVTKCVAVRLTASDGSVGISSIDPSTRAVSPNTAPELAATVANRLAPALAGEDPLNLHRVYGLAFAIAPEQPGACAAVELACADLVCRRLGLALHQYLGGKVVDEVRFNGWIGELPPEAAAAEGRRWLEAGFASAKIKVGSGVEADYERVAAVRDAVGAGFELRMDANEQYTRTAALELCRLIKPLDVRLFEQPVHRDDLEGLAEIRRSGGVAVMADESVSDHASLVAVIKADCVDYVKFGIKQAGGLLRSASMLATAQAAGLPVVLGHGFGLDMSTMAEIMLGATSSNVVPGLECVGPLKVTDSVATRPLDLSSGRLMLPDGPGIGLELDEQKLERYAFAPESADG